MGLLDGNAKGISIRGSSVAFEFAFIVIYG